MTAAQWAPWVSFVFGLLNFIAGILAYRGRYQAWLMLKGSLMPGWPGLASLYLEVAFMLIAWGPWSWGTRRPCSSWPISSCCFPVWSWASSRCSGCPRSCFPPGSRKPAGKYGQGRTGTHGTCVLAVPCIAVSASIPDRGLPPSHDLALALTECQRPHRVCISTRRHRVLKPEVLASWHRDDGWYTPTAP